MELPKLIMPPMEIVPEGKTWPRTSGVSPQAEVLVPKESRALTLGVNQPRFASQLLHNSLLGLAFLFLIWEW
jgi:hypothetical protein